MEAGREAEGQVESERLRQVEKAEVKIKHDCTEIWKCPTILYLA
jgi:hypothetical protein